MALSRASRAGMVLDGFMRAPSVKVGSKYEAYSGNFE